MVRFSYLLLASALSLSALAASAVGHAPAIVAHRGGTADAPENTRIAIETALKNGADAIWITQQESKDGVIVLYRPSDLKALTNRQGPVSAYTTAQLAETDAGWAFARGDTHPFRGQGIDIPRLDDVLKAFPHVTFYLDIKSPDADPAQFGQALLATLESTDSLNRIRVYSTDAKYLQALPTAIPRFESRDETRTLLANITMAHQCDVKPDNRQPRWYGLELKREVEVVE
ncbi:TPA: glycerophosphodiester phosphodiesterase family protein, partial [Serratia marcescens]